MRKLISYIAISLDGKIANPDGSVDWLHELPNPEQLDYGYEKFIKSVDTTIMGNATYQQVLGFGSEFPYAGKENFVLTRDSLKQRDANVSFIAEDAVSFISSLKNKKGKSIWLIGGAQANTLLLNAGLVDELRIFVMPIILGNGIPLFSTGAKTKMLKLADTRVYESSGVVEMTYKIIIL